MRETVLYLQAIFLFFFVVPDIEIATQLFVNKASVIMIEIHFMRNKKYGITAILLNRRRARKVNR